MRSNQYAFNNTPYIARSHTIITHLSERSIVNADKAINRVYHVRIVNVSLYMYMRMRRHVPRF